MITVDEATALVLAAAEAQGGLTKERVSLSDAMGRVLAETVTAPTDLPEADYSAMDGYVLRIEALEDVAELILPVVGECRTGHTCPELEPGTCLRIFTGARIPARADAVVMQENVERRGDDAVILKRPVVGENIRRRGEDLHVGDEVLGPGIRLTPFHLGLLATVERTEVLVYARPRVAIVCTGDELRPPGSGFFGGSVAESNSVALAALCRAAGAEVWIAPLVQDEREPLREALLLAKERADVVLTVGGVSVGDHDLVRPVLEEMGAHIVFHKVKIKPGKPALLAELEETLFLGLPGNPSSAQVIFSVLGVVLLRALSGDRKTQLPYRSAQLRHAYAQKPGRRGFLRGLYGDGFVEVLGNQASGASTSMAWANALVVLSEDRSEYAAGDEVSILAYSDFC